MLTNANPNNWNALLSMLGLAKQESVDKDIVAIENQLSNIQAELELYKGFFVEVYYFSGSYPNWKAHADFRQLMEKLGNPVFTRGNEPTVGECVNSLDTYFSRLVSATETIINRSVSTSDKLKDANSDCRRVVYKAVVEGAGR